MLRAIDYSVRQAFASLRRSRRQAALAMLTIAAGLFVLGFFLVVHANLQRLLTRWSEAAELSVYLNDDATAEQVRGIEAQVARSGLAATTHYVSKGEAALQFKADFPDLARTADTLERNPLPASVDVRLNAGARGAGAAVDALAATLGEAAGVADVRYDRRLLVRLGTALRVIRWTGMSIVTLLAIAAALTVASVVRLGAHARREEIEIMQLVGAPLAFVRGPFVAEGLLQGGGGALLAIAALGGVYLAGRVRFGRAAADVLGLEPVHFLPFHVWVSVVAAGMVLGCVGGLVVARSVK